MSLWTIIVSILEAIFSPFFAWQFDNMDEPDVIRAKRRELVDTIPRGASVLEIGAGTGSTLAAGAYEASAGRFGRLVLSEPDRGMRNRLIKKLEGSATGVTAGELNVVEASLPTLPFPDASFSNVVIFFVLSHVDGRRPSLSEIARILQPGGKMLFIDHGVHAHGHGHGAGERGSHGPQAHHGTVAHAGETKLPFFMEWLSFLRHGVRKDDFDLDMLIGELRDENKLEEVFVTRMTVQHKFFHEIVYGCFERKPDPDS